MTVEAVSQLGGTLTATQSLGGSLSSSGSLSARIGNVNFITTYDGIYEITPTADEQTLDTMDKMLTDNVTVHATPYSEVSNIYGGTTVTIL